MKITLLLLESNEQARVTYADALRVAGCTVIIAADSEDAYTAVVANMPDVIVVGFEAADREARFTLCKRIGRDTRARHIPILLTSAAVDQEDLERATATGVLALVLESRDASKLVSAVEGVTAARLKTPPARASLDSPRTEGSRRDKLA
jgi:CheY-like chemotaxis protein